MIKWVTVKQVLEHLDEQEQVKTVVEEETESVSAQQSRAEEQLLLVDNYVKGMLKAFPSLPLERIHTMLGSYLEDYCLTIAQLGEHLAKMVKEEKLEGSPAAFSLRK